MKRKRLLRQLYLSYLIITISSLIAALLFAFWSLRDFYFEQVRSDLEARALLIIPHAKSHFATPYLSSDLICQDLGKKIQTRTEERAFS